MSGGFDSSLLVYQLLRRGWRVRPLYIRCGLRWERAELYWSRRLLAALRCPRLTALQIVDVPLRSVYGRHWSMGAGPVPSALTADAAVYLPGRNLLLLGHAAVACASRNIRTIALGLLRGNPFPDASPRFLSQLGRCVSQALGAPIRITAPFRRLTKAQVLRRCRRAPVGLTFSCLQPRGLRHCGRCNKCAERQRAFRAARVPDPTNYAI